MTTRRKQRFYAVRSGREVGIFDTWSECERQVKGCKNAIFKSFKTIQEAENFLNEVPENVDSSIPEDSIEGSIYEYDIYTDGSYSNGQYSWALFVFKNGVQVFQEAGKGTMPWAASTFNVAGEIEAVMKAVQWAFKGAEPKPKIIIHHDYIGLSEWAYGRWRTTKKITQMYAAFIKPYMSFIKFHKVKGHSDVEGNILADCLAADVLKGKNEALNITSDLALEEDNEKGR